MAKQDIDVRRTISADPDTVFRLVGDSSTWPDWTPIESFQLIEEGDLGGVGEIRVFRTGRVRVREEIVEKVRGRRLVYELLSGLAVKDYRAEIDIEPSAAGSEVRWHTTFSPKFPGSGWIYRRALQKATEQFVGGLAERAEGGVSVQAT